HLLRQIRTIFENSKELAIQSLNYSNDETIICRPSTIVLWSKNLLKEPTEIQTKQQRLLIGKASVIVTVVGFFWIDGNTLVVRQLLLLL
ncbi:hypothetical protein DERF_000318, partial [Dermatophagoides farinae]